MDIEYSKQANAYLDKQTDKQAERIRQAVKALPCGDVKKLRGIENGYRLRVGDARVLFEKEGSMIHVFKIDNRGDVYK
ncbi:MAG: type II toxin-antitoxin system RelE/ParE family toxin [Oscillospiraceae bacterium]|jgi:mRNA interferase RelE/StbE|nr:type II toxin-antitoxin system RelE/ParE family toxin [Oscillospiraceae bacterium]